LKVIVLAFQERDVYFMSMVVGSRQGVKSGSCGQRGRDQKPWFSCGCHKC